jgi:hypothetical protein
MEKRIRAQMRAKKGMLAIARHLKVGTGTVQRIKREMEGTSPSTKEMPLRETSLRRESLWKPIAMNHREIVSFIWGIGTPCQ